MALRVTRAHWIKKTTRLGVSRTNPLITDLDVLLDHYEQSPDIGRKLKFLILIRYFCRLYLATKTGWTFRKKYVQDLLDAATDELSTQAMQTAMNDRFRGVRKGNQLPGKGLEDSLGEYMLEAMQPRTKASYGLTSNINIQRMPATEIVQLMQGGRTNLDILDAIQDRQLQGQIQVSVEYLDKTERAQFELGYDHQGTNKWYLGASDMPYHTTGHADFWAETEAGVFYLKPVPNGFQGGSFHHSSFLSGKPIKCAGEIIIHNGDLKFISNMSGHYRPGTQQLIGAVRDLQAMGLSLMRFAAGDKQTGLYWFMASNFLAKNGVERLGPRGEANFTVKQL